MKTSNNSIWFEKNDGQFGNTDILYGFRTSFGSMGVYKNKLRIVTEQTAKNKKVGSQVVDITFPGSHSNWSVTPGKSSTVKGTYNTQSGAINARIYNEITLTNVYTGIDLRLYTGKQGELEFDWLVAKAVDYKKIRMNFTGQDNIKTGKNGEIVIDMKYDDMKIMIPETFQFIKGRKKLFTARMKSTGNKSTMGYDIAGNIDPNLPLVIDPVMIWSTYMHNNTNTFDEYLYTIAVNSASEVYACGVTNEAISTAYMSNVSPGYISAYTYSTGPGGKIQSVILYRLNPTGTAITAWTYTGQTNNVPVAMGIFPDDRILVVYQTDTMQIFSPDLTSRYYSDVISSDVGDNVLSYQSLAIIDNDVFYVGGVAESPLPSPIIPALAPDITIERNEGIILRINNASTSPDAEWGTYVGGSDDEAFTAIAATPDKSKIAFAVHVDGTGIDYPALVNDVDNSIDGTELLIGVIPVGKPKFFSVFSYLGGSSNEGLSSKNQSAALVAADNNYFYVAGNTTSNDLPGTAGSAQPSIGAGGGRSNQFISQVPLDGSASAGFITSYNGGSDVDIVGGLVIDYRTHDVLLFGSSESTDFPVYNASAYSPYYQPTHGSKASGPLDITYTVFANGLASRKFSTYIGGSHNDYLGSTGKLQGTGHFHYNAINGLTYIGTTIHSDETTIPPQWMSGIPGFDKDIPPATSSKDNHYIFAMNPNTSDFGDAPASYDAGIPASSDVAYANLRIGAEEDAEEEPNSSAAADGDDIQNFGSADDEDGIVILPYIMLGDTVFAATVSVFNDTGADVNLAGWIDTDNNGVFDAYEYAAVNVPSGSSQQNAALYFTNLPAFTTVTGYTFLRLRISNIALTPADAMGAIGFGEVEDHMVLQGLILPIKLEQFTAQPQAEDVLIKWTVNKETNIRQYQVEHSTDAVHFTSTGINANAGKQNYSVLHTTPVEGTNFYRLRITATDGRISYSPLQRVQFSKYNSIKIVSNPVKDLIKINFSGTVINKPATISLFSPDGRMMMQKRIGKLNAAEAMDISRFANGHYILKVNTSSAVSVKEIVVLK